MNSNIAGNAKAGLSALSALLSLAGMALCIGALIASLVFLQGIEATVSTQIDSLAAAAGSLKDVAAPAADSAQNATQAIASASQAMKNYASLSGNLSDSMATIAAVPPFSLDARFASAANGMKEASKSFSDAAANMNATAESATQAATALRNASDDVENVKAKLTGAKQELSSAIGMLRLALIAFGLSLCALFSSVLLLSVSNLAERFLGKKDANGNEKSGK